MIRARRGLLSSFAIMLYQLLISEIISAIVSLPRAPRRRFCRPSLRTGLDGSRRVVGYSETEPLPAARLADSRGSDRIGSLFSTPATRAWTRWRRLFSTTL